MNTLQYMAGSWGLPYLLQLHKQTFLKGVLSWLLLSHTIDSEIIPWKVSLPSCECGPKQGLLNYNRNCYFSIFTQ